MEIEDDWEPYVKINIFNQNLLAYCDIGSMISTMPKTVYDSLKLVSMVDLRSFHDHSNGNLYEIKGEVKNLQVQFGKRDAAVDFFIMESTNQGNIVLGRDFLRAMKGFIDVGKGKIHLRGKPRIFFLGRIRMSLLESNLKAFMIMMIFVNFDFLFLPHA